MNGLPNSRACVDAKLVIKLALDEESSDKARARWEQWRNEDAEIVAPSLLFHEVTSTLRNKVYRGVMVYDEATEALEALLSLPITVIEVPNRHERAWELATRFSRPSAYDANYLVVAEAMECAFWTADRRLYNAVKEGFPAINLVGPD
jgi:predicted nucleic acid-binding protein